MMFLFLIQEMATFLTLWMASRHQQHTHVNASLQLKMSQESGNAQHGMSYQALNEPYSSTFRMTHTSLLFQAVHSEFLLHGSCTKMRIYYWMERFKDCWKVVMIVVTGILYALLHYSSCLTKHQVLQFVLFYPIIMCSLSYFTHYKEALRCTFLTPCSIDKPDAMNQAQDVSDIFMQSNGCSFGHLAHARSQAPRSSDTR